MSYLDVHPVSKARPGATEENIFMTTVRVDMP